MVLFVLLLLCKYTLINVYLPNIWATIFTKIGEWRIFTGEWRKDKKKAAKRPPQTLKQTNPMKNPNQNENA